MARDFSKNLANYMSVGQNAIGALLNGFSQVMVSAWINYDTLETTANNNRIVSVIIDGSSTGIYLGVHNGTSAVLRVGARSVVSDSFQTGDGTTVLSSGTWYQIGGIIDINGDTITPYVNGVAEGGGAVTFGNTSYTDGTPTAGMLDGIGAAFTASVPSSTNAQFDGRIACVCLWASNTAFTAADQAALAARIAPNLVRPDAIRAYFPLLGFDSPERDHWGGLSGTITGTVAAADHPNIIYPSGPLVLKLAGAAGSSSPSGSPSASASSSPSSTPSSTPSASASSSPSTSVSSSPSASASSTPSASASSSPSASPSPSSSPSSSASSSPSASVSASPSASPSASVSTSPSASASASPSASVSASPSVSPSASASASPSASPSPSSSVSASPSTSPSGEDAVITIEGNVFTRETGGVNVDSNRLLKFQMANTNNLTFTFEETSVT